MSILADPKSVKALAIDLDGTVLAPGTVLSERTINAIHSCTRLGLKIIIATGRAIEAAERFRLSLGAEGPMVYYNGAVIADMPSGRILRSTLMSVEAAEFCVDFSRETGVFCQLYIPGGVSGGNGGRISLLVERDSPEREMYLKHTGVAAELVDLKEVLRRPGLPGCVKLMFLAEPEVLDGIRPKLSAHFGGSAYIAQTHKTFLEIMDADVSKGRGLKFVMERLSLRPEELIAFGDEENDLPMFGVAGFSAATSNAKENVKAGADIVIGSNAEDGVAVFLEEFFAL